MERVLNYLACIGLGTGKMECLDKPWWVAGESAGESWWGGVTDPGECKWLGLRQPIPCGNYECQGM